jgi:saccharopine dehydrogenase (NAD+, L-lysine forming)
MKTIRLGLIREGKVPPDKRVPLTPSQAARVKSLFPHVEVVAESSEIRAYSDDEYRAAGIEVVTDIRDCDILMGVKEVPVPQLVPNKTYLFFSHTFKKQPYNAKLLRAVLDNKIRLVDYEIIKDSNNQRIIGFGKYAGIVGCYNGFLTYGLKTGRYKLKPAHQCFDRKEMEGQLAHVDLPSDFKLVLTGFGRVGMGAREVLALMPQLKEVSPASFLNDTFDGPVFTQLNVEDYFGRIDDQPFTREDFYTDSSGYKSTFPRYMRAADMYISCHYWSDKSPFIATREDFRMPDLGLKVVADISADIDGPIGCTLRPSVIAYPIYGYNPQTEQETDFMQDGAIAVMAIDNLPCELSRDASEYFGEVLIERVFPALLNGEDPDRIIERASETDLNGNLMPQFQYLAEYANGSTV